MENTAVNHLVNGVNLHVIEAGPANGPLVILLHGFPDFWWGWRHQIGPLTAQGFRVVVPDGRGYGLSDKPSGARAYKLDTLAADVIALANVYTPSTFRLVGHDWGGVVAWQVAARYPHRVEQLAILNAPHPDVFMRFVRRHLKQLLKSYYAVFFQLPSLPEIVLRAQGFAWMRRALTSSSRPGTFTSQDLERYVAEWSRPGALTAMLDYYRALGRRRWVPLARIRPPTLVLWGMHDAFIEPGAARASLKLCDVGRSLCFENAGHWIQLEESEAVNQALVNFFRAP